jgi:hypothetical protein
VRQNSASNGRGAPYDPYSVSFIDTHTQVFGNHSLKVGGEVRLIRRSPGRHHLHLLQPERVPCEPAPVGAVPRRSQRAERVQPRRERPAPHAAGLLHRLRRTNGA